MSKNMYNLLLIKGNEESLTTFKQQTAHAWIFNSYKGILFNPDSLLTRCDVTGVFALSFKTDWQPPYLMIEKMSADYPDLKFELTYEEEQVRFYDDFHTCLTVEELINFCGTAIFSAGECVSHSGGDDWGIVLNTIKAYS